MGNPSLYAGVPYYAVTYRPAKESLLEATARYQELCEREENCVLMENGTVLAMQTEWKPVNHRRQDGPLWVVHHAEFGPMLPHPKGE